jgi:hypothetical protein
VASISWLAASAAWAFNKPDFPRLGGYLIGSPQNYEDAGYQSQIARLNVAILNVWPGWNGFYTRSSVQQVAQSIKAINPNTLLFLYQDINELQGSPPAAWQTLFGQLNSNHWWLTSSGLSGALVASTWGNGFDILNTTTGSAKDASGERYIDWEAKYNAATFGAPNPAIDGFYTDNVFWKPRVDGDWNLSGAVQSRNDAATQAFFRQGYVAYFNDLKALMPGKYQLGNTSDWGQSNTTITEYVGQLSGGVMEALIGYSYSPETWGGWKEMMAEYRKIMGAMAQPALAIFHQNGSPTDYQSFRYGFASCLMDEAYYYFSANNSYAGVNWFDEFNHPLGAETSPPSTTAWQNGVYRRDFQNGIALVNPKGNGAQTVTLETTFMRISGSQAPSVNNGQQTSTVTLNDRDGIILLRLTPTPKPQPPSNFSAH